MTIGILGGGQLGRMLVLAGYPLGLSFRIFEPAEESSAAQIASRIRAEYDDYQSLYHLSQNTDVITYEFENVPTQTAKWLSERVPIFPGVQALTISQDRILEKSFFRDLGIRVPRFVAVENEQQFRAGVDSIGLPLVLKTTRFGYDGKGQMIIRQPADLATAWTKLGGRPLILEELVPFDRELSLISVRRKNGDIAYYPLVENHHHEGMLAQTIAPAPSCSTKLQQLAEQMARTTLEALNYVGVLAIEFFQIGEELWVNEMAPRVHNSGHWTIEGAVTSQFENHLRAILDWPLGSTAVIRPTAMINLIGCHPFAENALALPGIAWHWYGKSVRKNRKLGHITICANSESERQFLIEKIKSLQLQIEKNNPLVADLKT